MPGHGRPGAWARNGSACTRTRLAAQGGLGRGRQPGTWSRRFASTGGRGGPMPAIMRSERRASRRRRGERGMDAPVPPPPWAPPTENNHRRRNAGSLFRGEGRGGGSGGWGQGGGGTEPRRRRDGPPRGTTEKLSRRGQPGRHAPRCGLLRRVRNQREAQKFMPLGAVRHQWGFRT